MCKARGQILLLFFTFQHPPCLTDKGSLAEAKGKGGVSARRVQMTRVCSVSLSCPCGWELGGGTKPDPPEAPRPDAASLQFGRQRRCAVAPNNWSIEPQKSKRYPPDRPLLPPGCERNTRGVQPLGCEVRVPPPRAGEGVRRDLRHTRCGEIAVTHCLTAPYPLQHSTTSVQLKIVNGLNFTVWSLRPANTSVP